MSLDFRWVAIGLRSGPQMTFGFDTPRGPVNSQMSTKRPTSRRLVASVGFLAGLTMVCGVTLAFVFPAEGLAEEGSGPRVAGSVCEAHELRALHDADPHLEIEIPKEFDTPWPTREACESHAAALDEETPGLVQPIPFSHKAGVVAE